MMAQGNELIGERMKSIIMGCKIKITFNKPTCPDCKREIWQSIDPTYADNTHVCECMKKLWNREIINSKDMGLCAKWSYILLEKDRQMEVMGC